MEALTAVNVLLKPDEAARERARACNAALRVDLSSGFAFDATHEPHITVLQLFVRTIELDDVAAVVGEVVTAHDSVALELHAVGLSSGELATRPAPGS